MLKYKDKIFTNRKEAKDFLGGTNAYNRAFREKEIEFVNENYIASYGNIGRQDEEI